MRLTSVRSRSLFTSRPPTRTVPLVGCRMPARMRISVVLPAPLGPSNPNMPLGIVRFTPLSACTLPPYTLVRFSIVTFIIVSFLLLKSKRPLPSRMLPAQIHPHAQHRRQAEAGEQRNTQIALGRRRVQPQEGPVVVEDALLRPGTGGVEHCADDAGNADLRTHQVGPEPVASEEELVDWHAQDQWQCHREACNEERRWQ